MRTGPVHVGAQTVTSAQTTKLPPPAPGLYHHLPLENYTCRGDDPQVGRVNGTGLPPCLSFYGSDRPRPRSTRTSSRPPPLVGTPPTSTASVEGPPGHRWAEVIGPCTVRRTVKGATTSS